MKNHTQPNGWLYRIVVGVLGLTVVVSVAGTILLARAGQSTLKVLIALGSSVSESLTGLLTPSPLNR
jgi:hypothetical protein